MKKSILLLLFSVGLNCIAQSDLSAGNTPAPYDIKSGKIVYRFYNGLQQGEKIVVFDDYGALEKMVSNTIISNGDKGDESFRGDTLSEMILKTKGFLYKINLNDGTGFKLTRKETLPINLNDLRPGQIITGEDTVLTTYTCTVVESFGATKTCYWNRIPIKKQMIGTSSRVEEFAVKIDENYVPSKSDFEVPENILIK